MSTVKHSATIAPEPPPEVPPTPYVPPVPGPPPPETIPGGPVSDPPFTPDPGGPITAIPAPILP